MDLKSLRAFGAPRTGKEVKFITDSPDVTGEGERSGYLILLLEEDDPIAAILHGQRTLRSNRKWEARINTPNVKGTNLEIAPQKPRVPWQGPRAAITALTSLT